MLVQFSVKNFASLKNENTFDMTAIKAYKEHEYNLIEIGLKDKFLKVAAVYGANSSGKSNFIWAFDTFQTIIRKSFNNIERDEGTILEQLFIPYLFDKKSRISPIEFEVIFIHKGFEYKYGFIYNSEKIINEWLYRKSLQTNRNSTIYERNKDNTIVLGASVKKSCDHFVDQIPKDTLALSFFNRLNLSTTVYKDAYEGIMDTLVLGTDFNEDCSNVLVEHLPGEIDEGKEELLMYLEAIDSRIKDIKYVEKDGEKNILVVHENMQGEKYISSLFLESEGTLKSLALYLFAKAAIITDRSLLIDELNIKLHPLLLKFIIDLFNTSKSRAQLIYTTHDTTLLNRRFFRRDQVWFVQKEDDGSSALYSLAEFKVRPDASFEKEYLGGVYGGIPTLKDFKLDEVE